MIASERVAKIRWLLQQGRLSHRKIARRTGVSRGSVWRIASGKRPDYEKLRRPWDELWEKVPGPPVRCTGCGGMVYMPCWLCHVRKLITEDTHLRQNLLVTAIGQPLGVRLGPEHRARYEEVRAWQQTGRSYPRTRETEPWSNQSLCDTP
jgi:hypothetical protein